MPFLHAVSKVTLGMDIQAADKGREGRFGLQPAVCWPVLENVISIRSGALPVLFTLYLLRVQTYLTFLEKKKLHIVLELKPARGALYLMQDVESKIFTQICCSLIGVVSAFKACEQN